MKQFIIGLLTSEAYRSCSENGRTEGDAIRDVSVRWCPEIANQSILKHLAINAFAETAKVVTILFH